MEITLLTSYHGMILNRKELKGMKESRKISNDDERGSVYCVIGTIDEILELLGEK